MTGDQWGDDPGTRFFAGVGSVLAVVVGILGAALMLAGAFAVVVILWRLAGKL